MKIGIWNNYEIYSKGRIFDRNAYKIGDDLGYPIRYLKSFLESNGHDVTTLDQIPIHEYDKVIFFDYPSNPKFAPEILYKLGIPSYLFLSEVEIINPLGYDPKKQNFFRKIFTYDDSRICLPRLIKYCIPHRMEISKPEFDIGYDDRPGFVVLIAGNKTCSDPRELYSERVNAIKWYEKNASEYFDLFGAGWERYKFGGPRIIRALNRFDWLTRALGERRISYRGIAGQKKQILARYRFSICYENAKDIPGYITEKLFDSMAAGTIPIYLGAPNIADYVNPDAYIDGRKYKSYDELHAYLTSLSRIKYDKIKSAIKEFIEGDQGRLFSASSFADLVQRDIINDGI